MLSEINRKRFGEFLARHRRMLNISQTEAGRRAGMSRTQYTRIELGESGTRIDNVEPLARAVEADISLAYELAGFVPPAPEVKENVTEPEKAVDPEFKILLYHFEEIPPERREYLKEHVRTLLEIELHKLAAAKGKE